MKLQFLGATGTVTGSKYLVTIENQKILVDCGLFQGYKELRLRNWVPLPIDAKEIDAVLLTHAHLDHSGYLPLLVKNGFTGPICATPATRDLCAILLPDSGYLQEEDARRANKYGYSKHTPALPLYTKEDAQIAMRQFKVVEFDQLYSNILSHAKFTWHHAGHILGASMIEIEALNKKLIFSGDLGRMQDALMKAPENVKSTDYLVLESTYGDRLHGTVDVESVLGKMINDTAKRGGTVLIAAFAVGRAQSILYYLEKLKSQRKIPNIPIYLDSPMSIDATEIFRHYIQEHNLSREECEKVCRVATYIHTPEESKALSQNAMPKIIISASGMATGGRILHHLKVYASDARNSILLAGYQAGGTRGARLMMGEKQIKIHGEMIAVNAPIFNLSNLSAHADYSETLSWLKHFEKPPKQIFITHGEPEGAAGLKDHIESELHWNCVIPEYLDEIELI